MVFASKAFPATAVMSLFAQEGLGCDVASAGELHLALRAGFDPATIVHARQRPRRRASCAMALDAGVGHIVIDNDGDIDRLERLTAGAPQPPAGADPRHPGRARRHAREDLDRPGRLEVRRRPRRRARRRSTACARVPGLDLRGLHLHIGSQLFSLEPFRAAIAAIAPLGDVPGLRPRRRPRRSPTPTSSSRRRSTSYVGALVEAARELLGPGRRLLVEPGRALVANGGVTLYRVIGVKRNVSTWVSVDGGMSDNLRPMLYGARYQADDRRSPRRRDARARSPASTASRATC